MWWNRDCGLVGLLDAFLLCLFIPFTHAAHPLCYDLFVSSNAVVVYTSETSGKVASWHFLKHVICLIITVGWGLKLALGERVAFKSYLGKKSTFSLVQAVHIKLGGGDGNGNNQWVQIEADDLLRSQWELLSDCKDEIPSAGTLLCALGAKKRHCLLAALCGEEEPCNGCESPSAIAGVSYSMNYWLLLVLNQRFWQSAGKSKQEWTNPDAWLWLTWH